MYQTPAIQALAQIRTQIDEVLAAVERQDELDRLQGEDFVRLNRRPGLEDLDWTLAQPIQNDFVLSEPETPRAKAAISTLASDPQPIEISVGNLEPYCTPLLRTVKVDAHSLGVVRWPNDTEDHLFVTLDDHWIVHHSEFSTETGHGLCYVKEIRPEQLLPGGQYEELGHACGFGRALTLGEALELCKYVI